MLTVDLLEFFLQNTDQTFIFNGFNHG